MAKKIFARARLVKGARWYIDYTVFHAENGTETRHRHDFDLNKIEDLQVRELVGERLVDSISLFVGIQAPGSAPEKQSVPLLLAVDQALQIKLTSPRRNTHKGYKSISNTLFTWCRDNNLHNAPVDKFTKRHARLFFDWLQVRRKYKGTTLNNYLIHLRALWSEMKARELVAENPWSAIKPVRKNEKTRRPFSQLEKVVVASEIEKTDYWLFRGLLLQYFCFIRPVELIRLRFKNFDLKKGIVLIESAQAKNWRKRWATIPESVRYYFLDGVFDAQPANWHVFGLRDGQLQPGPVAINDGRMYKRHRKVLERLLHEERLQDISGLTWYSWKDTGITHHTRTTSPISTKDQAGHHDLDMTMIYYHTPEVNVEYQVLPNDLSGPFM